LGKKGFVIEEPWPEWDDELTIDREVTIVIQVNGKLRGEFNAALNTSQKEIETAALNVEKVKPHIEGKTIRRVIVVPNKLVNIVV
jgi:leucyl-tRNA synthetase